MNRNIILIMALLLLNPSVHAQSIGGDAYNSNGPKPSSQPRIVTPHCDEPISKVMAVSLEYKLAPIFQKRMTTMGGIGV